MTHTSKSPTADPQAAEIIAMAWSLAEYDAGIGEGRAAYRARPVMMSAFIALPALERWAL